MVYICPGGNCTGIAIFFFDKVSHLKHPSVHPSASCLLPSDSMPNARRGLRLLRLLVQPKNSPRSICCVWDSTKPLRVFAKGLLKVQMLAAKSPTQQIALGLDNHAGKPRAPVAPLPPWQGHQDGGNLLQGVFFHPQAD